jgi:hypothetical protein
VTPSTGTYSTRLAGDQAPPKPAPSGGTTARRPPPPPPPAAPPPPKPVEIIRAGVIGKEIIK